jgi:type II secretory pathway component PulK
MTSGRPHARGYALILAVVVVALLALVLLAVARVQGDLSPGLRALQRDVEREVATHSAVARVEYLLLTEPIGPRSVIVGGPRDLGAASSAGMRNARELRLDGRFYVVGGFEPGADSAFASVQDEAGLLSLNTGDSAALGALLDQAGVANARGLADALVDYTDEDDLTGPAGAEEGAYRRLGLPTPLNQALTNRWRALEALGWREGVDVEEAQGFWANVRAAPRGAALNVNTAPRPVLAAVLGNERAARALVNRRDQGEVRTHDELEGLTGVNTRADGVVLATEVGAAFRVVVAFSGGRRRYESQVVLAEPGANRPMYWREMRLAAVGYGRDEFEAAESLPEHARTP